MAELDAAQQAEMNRIRLNFAIDKAWEVLGHFGTMESKDLSSCSLANASQAVLNLMQVRRMLEAAADMEKHQETMKAMTDNLLSVLGHVGPKPPSH